MTNTKRFTQEDLLNAMGLKVGDLLRVWIWKADFMVEDTLDGIMLQHTERPEEQHWIEELVGTDYEIITPPKYTLTETEKHIVLAIDEKWKWIARTKKGNMFLFLSKPVKKDDYWGVLGELISDFYAFNHHFQFIQWSDHEPVSLDELRQIAKGETK